MTSAPKTKDIPLRPLFRMAAKTIVGRRLIVGLSELLAQPKIIQLIEIVPERFKEFADTLGSKIFFIKGSGASIRKLFNGVNGLREQEAASAQSAPAKPQKSTRPLFPHLGLS